MQTTFSSTHKCASISINFQVPKGWYELGEKQLRYVYPLIASNFTSDEIKTLGLLHWSDTKVHLPPFFHRQLQTSFKQLSAVVISIQYTHLMDSYLVQFHKSLALWHTLFDRHGIKILHIGETYKLID